MLSRLENRLLAALKPLHQEGTTITAGLSRGPTTGQTNLVEVIAEKLVVTSGSNRDDLITRRGPAFLAHTQHWSADGTIRDFSLPGETSGQIIEVESPPGHPVKPGDDYELDSSVIKFYRPPAASDQAVAALVRQGPAHGFQEMQACAVTVAIISWADNSIHADSLLSLSLSTVLSDLAAIGTLELQSDSSTGVRIRLLGPVASLESIERAAQTADQSYLVRAIARIIIQGDGFA